MGSEWPGTNNTQEISRGQVNHRVAIQTIGGPLVILKEFIGHIHPTIAKMRLSKAILEEHHLEDKGILVHQGIIPEIGSQKELTLMCNTTVQFTGRRTLLQIMGAIA